MPGLIISEAQAWALIQPDDHVIVLQCNDCGEYFLPGTMKRYGDQACPNCNSLSTGFVTEETL
jgi:uncharacterized OB-fold protein